MKKMAARRFLAAILSAIFCPAASALAAAFTVNTVTCLPPNHSVTIGFVEYLGAVQTKADEKYPGKLKINHRGGVEVIAANEQIEAVRTGMIDMIATAGSYYVSVMPEIDVLALSQLMPWEERKAPLFRYLDEIHREKVNAVYVGRLGSGSVFQLFTRKPFSTLRDLAGLRIRVSPTNIPIMRLLDCEPIAMPNAELFTALERSVIDGFVLPPPEIVDFGLIPMISHSLAQTFYSPSNPVLANAGFWDGMPAELKEIFVAEMELAEHKVIEHARGKMKIAYDAAQAANIVFVELSPEESKRFGDMADKALMDTVKAKAPAESEKIFALSRK
ncbi:MAG: TRAP transporter substrate-binding protein DctP [Planctomycetota bacterium]|jgi:TRAP-type C4-dicarboxylate transport system substrate-binding protein|nr:TRAP transporter substrate-binding protein DctP [Planctomycetota bacterium]